MSNRHEVNVAITAALRNAGVKDVRPMWARVQELRDAGNTPAQIVAALAPRTPEAPKAKRATRVSEPKAEYKAKRETRLSERNAAYSLTLPRPNTVPVMLTREGSPSLFDHLAIGPARPKQHGSGLTHDVERGTERFTLSPAALDRLLTGKGTRVWVNGLAYLATVAQ